MLIKEKKVMMIKKILSLILLVVVLCGISYATSTDPVFKKVRAEEFMRIENVDADASSAIWWDLLRKGYLDRSGRVREENFTPDKSGFVLKINKKYKKHEQGIIDILARRPLSLDLFLKPVVFSDSISLLLSLASVSLIPFFLLTTTSFLRIIIVLGSMRMAMGTQQSPPNMVLIGITLFMTIFVMSPVWNEINDNAIQPYHNRYISQDQAFKEAVVPIRNFMLRQVRDDDLALFMEFSTLKVEKLEDVPIWVIIPAFVISEVKAAFSIAFVLYIPFVLVDLIVANVLLSLGMFMLSPVMVSLPFKILLFVLADGFSLIAKGLLLSFK